MTPKINLSVEIQENLYKALEEMSKESGKSIEILVEEAIADLADLFEEYTDIDLEAYLTEEIKEDNEITRVFPEDDGC
jgi:predicted transcriptional regulator